MFQASIDPVGGNLILSALVACIPIVIFFVCLVAVKLKAHISAMIALAVSIVVAIFAFKMPAGFALLSATQGAAYGLMPICLIIFSAVWFYGITEVSGRSADLRKLFDNIGGGDLRLQVILIAFCFGSLLESLAGFGAPIAITASMLLALRLPPGKIALACLIGNTAPVAFGTLAIPITTAANVAAGAEGAAATAIHVAAITGIIAPIFSFLIPFLILIIFDGKHGIKDCWVPALIIGLSYSVVQWLVSNFFAYELTGVIASLAAFGVGIMFLRIWKVRGSEDANKRLGVSELAQSVSPEENSSSANEKEKLTPARIWMALMPYAFIIAVFFVTKMALPLNFTDIKIPWPGLTEMSADGSYSSLVLNYAAVDPGTTFTFSWLSNCGTLIIICGFIITAVFKIFNEGGRYSITFGAAVAELGHTFMKLRFTILTIACALALAYVMNFSGQTIAIGQLLAGTGAAFAFISPILGWVGTAITGSDTSANALFSSLQVAAANANPTLAGVSAELFLASNTMGGVIGKMISPQSLAIAAATTKETESNLFKKSVKWSLVLLLLLCIVIFLYASVLNFMVP